MTLPLPYTLGLDQDPIQANFDAIKKQFPLSRKHMQIEAAHNVGDSGEPAFQNSWVNYDTSAYQGARFWKDPMGLVHIEGLIKSGTLNTTAFTLPAGYRPGLRLAFASMANGAFARVDVLSDGTVVPVSGSNAYFSISIPPFRQEQ